MFGYCCICVVYVKKKKNQKKIKINKIKNIKLWARPNSAGACVSGRSVCSLNARNVPVVQYI